MGVGALLEWWSAVFRKDREFPNLVNKYSFRKQAVFNAVNHPGSIEELQEGTYLDKPCPPPTAIPTSDTHTLPRLLSMATLTSKKTE